VSIAYVSIKFFIKNNLQYTLKLRYRAQKLSFCWDYYS